MYTIQENVRIVISLLKEYNIHYVVLSPGGTNIPVVSALQNDSFFHCYSVPDERSAIYFAIGLYWQTGEIIATSCTSAQATRNYVPGLTEAFYKHVPILAITTSKLERYSYQDYMQAPDQTSLPKDAVKNSYSLPQITDENTRFFVCQTAREAITELTHRTPGPVQLNIRINDAQNLTFVEQELPKIRTFRRYMAWDDWKDVSLEGKKILIVIGEHRPFSQEEKKSIEFFAECYDAAIYAVHISNYNGKYAVHANLSLSSIHESLDSLNLHPDVLITIGGQTGDYTIFGRLVGLQSCEHWRVAMDGNVVDTYNILSKIFEVSETYFFNRLSKGRVILNEHTFFNVWKEFENAADYNIELPFSNAYIAQQLHDSIPDGSYMGFAILNSLRMWNFFPLASNIISSSPVGAFGIDGGMSILIGESMNTSQLCFMVTGDLAFFYDMNSLGIRHIKNNLRVLLINNCGGAEFKIMTRNCKGKVKTEDYISACGHNSTAQGWAENNGFKYIQASSKDELDIYKNEFVSKSNVPIVFEVFTNAEDELSSYNLLTKSSELATGKKIKDIVKGILGDKGVKTVKNIINGMS